MTDETAPCWCGKDWGHDDDHIGQAEAVLGFLTDAHLAMAERMATGLKRGWGTSFRGDYSDERARGRLQNAQMDFLAAFRQYRRGRTSIDELRQRAADLANQAFMVADTERLERNR